MSNIKALANLGQSIWYDYIQRTMISSGQLAELVSKGLGGVTSNPSIFEQAIAGSTDYDVDLNRLIAEDKSVNEIYEQLSGSRQCRRNPDCRRRRGPSTAAPAG